MKQWMMQGILLLAAIVMLAVPATAEEPEILLPRVYSGEPEFTDTKGGWCEENVKLCWQTGLLSGVTETTFMPSAPLSEAQVLVIAARLQDLLSGGTGVFREPAAGEAWYVPALEHYELAIEAANVTLSPTLSESKVMLSYTNQAPVPRRWFVQLMWGALEASGVKLPAVNEDIKIPDSDEHAVHVFYQAGILNGMDDYGSFLGSRDLNRGQAAAILARILDPAQRMTFKQSDFKDFDLCRDVLQLDPEMVLFSADGKEYTVLQYAEEILSAADSVNHPMHSEPDPEGALRDLRSFFRRKAAPYTLAQAVGIALTEEEETILLQTAQEKDGYRGLPSDYWKWSDCADLLISKLKPYYTDSYNGELPNAGIYFNFILVDEGDRILKTAVLSPEMDKVDLAGIEQRIHEFP